MSARLGVRLLWLAAAALAAATAWRLTQVSWQYQTTAPALHVEDRREHRFRDLTHTQTQRLLDGLLRRAWNAKVPRERALELARVAALQRERGLADAAAAAEREALQLGGNDPAVRFVLAQPLRLEDLATKP